MLSCLRSIKVSQRPFLCPLNVDSGGAEAETEEDFLVKNGGLAGRRLWRKPAHVFTLSHEPRQPLHQVRDEDDVHDVGEVRRPAGEGHQPLA